MNFIHFSLGICHLELRPGPVPELANHEPNIMFILCAINKARMWANFRLWDYLVCDMISAKSLWLLLGKKAVSLFTASQHTATNVASLLD